MVESSIPLITVGIVVLNRDWIIAKVLNSILLQTYPHEKIFILIVDGGSVDRTLEVAREVLEASDFNGFEIIVRKCNIPEGRNICIENMRGSMLLFWDSDVIMKPNAVEELVNTIESEKADIVTAETFFVFTDSLSKVEDKFFLETSPQIHYESCVKQVPAVMMGNTLIRKEAFNQVRFDPDLTLYEDMDFSVKAREKGFKMVKNIKVKAFDINIVNRKYSDIFADMPIKESIKGIRKKSRVKVLSLDFSVDLKKMTEYFFKNKRYLFYLSYLPMSLLSIYAFSRNSLLFLVFPAFLIFYLLYQFTYRGIKRGLKVFVKSFLVGFPISLLMVYYFIKYSLKK